MHAGSTIARLLRWLALTTDARGAVSVLAMPAVWLKRMRDRHLYASLTADQMRDAGLNPERIAREAAKRFWQA